MYFPIRDVCVSLITVVLYTATLSLVYDNEVKKFDKSEDVRDIFKFVIQIMDLLIVVNQKLLNCQLPLYDNSNNVIKVSELSLNTLTLTNTSLTTYYYTDITPIILLEVAIIE